MKLVPGRYYAGFTRPFFISNGMIEGKLSDLGGTNIRFFKRGELALPFDPKKVDPKYKDDWDEIVTVEYRGKERVEEDLDKLWAWLVRTKLDSKPAPPKASPPKPTPATSPKASSSSSSSSGKAISLLLVLWLLSER